MYFGEQNYTAGNGPLLHPRRREHRDGDLHVSQCGIVREGLIVVAAGALYWAEINFAACPATSYSILGVATP